MGQVSSPSPTPLPASFSISNQALGSYSDEAGERYNTNSNVVTVTVSSVVGITVTPNQTQPSATIQANEQATRLFTICNTGNTSSAYIVTSLSITQPATILSAHLDLDGSSTITAGDPLITINSTSTPLLSPGECIGVLVVISTNNSAPGGLLQIDLHATPSQPGVNGTPEGHGVIINAVGQRAVITHPFIPTLPPLKQINGSNQQTVEVGQLLNYSIAFRNSGDVPARNVLMSDPLVKDLEYVPNTLRLNNQPLTDANDGDEGNAAASLVEIRLAQLLPGEVATVSFKARAVAAFTVPASGITNFASFTSSNAVSTRSNPTLVVIDPFGIVFSGRGGPTARIPGARLTFASDLLGENPLQLPADSGYAPNTSNVNPFTSDNAGKFSFAPGQAQLDLSRHYYLLASAPGYLTRALELHFHPKPENIYSLTVKALDGQPIAVAGGFDLTSAQVTIDNIAAIAFNVPLFERTTLQITKTVDKPRAEIGDIVAYRIDLRNPTSATISKLVLRDQLPFSFRYAASSATITSEANALPIQHEPTVNNEALSFKLPDIPAGGSLTVLYRVRIGAGARFGDQINSAFATGRFASGDSISTPTVHAKVTISGGVFSTRQILIGRVYEDVDGNNRFNSTDRPIAGARLYLNNGQSVVTDSAGLYNIPALGDGSWVIALDPITIPPGLRLSTKGSLSNRTWTRLLRTPLGGGALLRQNFALVADLNQANGAVRQEQQPSLSPGDTLQPTPTTGPAPPRAPGVYKFVNTSSDSPTIPPGDIVLLSPKNGAFISQPSLTVTAAVHSGWFARLLVNGQPVSEKNIGETREHLASSSTTFQYVAVSLHPGPNSIRVIAVKDDEKIDGRFNEVVVYAPLPPTRIELISSKTQLQAGSRDSTVVTVKLLDQAGHLGQDSQVLVETSSGTLSAVGADGRVRPNDAATNRRPADALPPGGGASLSVTAATAEDKRLLVNTTGGVGTFVINSPPAATPITLRASSGQFEGQLKLAVTAENRPAILVAMGEASFGTAPEINLRNEEGNHRRRLGFFFSGPLPGNNHLTLAYDTQRPLNRTAGRDRLFQLDPLERVYPLFGDSSTRYEAAQSNSKLYLRVDHGRSYAQFGDFEPDFADKGLLTYGRKLTGVKLHLENKAGDFVTVSGARPDTAFGRDTFPGGGLSLLRLSHAPILPGSERVDLEVRDRRSPSTIISRETLVRSVDYNLDPDTGTLLLLRVISSFDYGLNLTQLVVTYEYQDVGRSLAVYTARARKHFERTGTSLGFSLVAQRQGDEGTFRLAGLELAQKFPQKGMLRIELGASRGALSGYSSSFAGVSNAPAERHNGNAIQVSLDQPLPFAQATVRADFTRTSANFFNPFGASVLPGHQEGTVAFEFKPRSRSTVRFAFTDERNHTGNVSNKRQGISARWVEQFSDRLRTTFGYDFRQLVDNTGTLTTGTLSSHLLTAGIDWKPLKRLDLSLVREQNLGDADPTYPTQTTISAKYAVNKWANLFVTQRLSANPIQPISDVTTTGFGFSSSKRETAVGVQSKLGQNTSLTSSYRLENGINGNDSFATIGLQHRIPVNKTFTVDAGFEHAFHVDGAGRSYTSLAIGASWLPNETFRSSVRYELRTRDGFGQALSIGAAGKLSENLTALSRMQLFRANQNGRSTTSADILAALAWRPLKSEKSGLLFSYNHRSAGNNAIPLIGGNSFSPSPLAPIIGSASDSRDSYHVVSVDGYRQIGDRLELFGRAAFKYSGNSQTGAPYLTTQTFLSQERLQYRLTNRFDFAAELRSIWQAQSQTSQHSAGLEIGLWVVPDLRVGVGYNVGSTAHSLVDSPDTRRRGPYITFTTKLSKLFNLFDH